MLQKIFPGWLHVNIIYNTYWECQVPISAKLSPPGFGLQHENNIICLSLCFKACCNNAVDNKQQKGVPKEDVGLCLSDLFY